MNAKYIFTVFLLLTATAGNTQSFQLISTSIHGVHNGGSCWGDYDNDGDLDLVVNGQKADWSSVTLVYENNNGQFVQVSGDFPALFGGTARWGDYDNDDDLDLLVCGMNGMGEGTTILLQNNAGVFTASPVAFTGITCGRAIWLDENRDGWLDILVAGDTLYNTPAAHLYHNNGDGTFTQVDTKIPASLNSSYTAGDFDNDGDDDLFLTGFYENTYASRLFRNDNNGSFSDTQIPFDSVAYGDMIFLDIDKDMDLDVIYMGGDLTGEYIARVYRNDGNDIFTHLPQPITGEWVGQIDTGDFNNDGYPDLAITGALCCGDAKTELYKNNGNGTFSPYNAGLPARTFSQIRFGDFDNDGDADILLTGLAETTTGLPMTQLFRNSLGSNTFGPNNPPSAPGNLLVSIDLNEATFHWSPATDDKTVPAALTYNLCVGNMPGNGNVFAPLANPVSGYTRVYAIGNVNQDTSWKITGLPAGTYFWSVQAKDHAMVGSAFAPEASFEITYTGMAEVISKPVITVWPNPASEYITLNSESAGDLIIADLRGIPVTFEKIMEGINLIRVAHLRDGLYVIRLYTGNKLTRTKLVIRHS